MKKLCMRTVLIGLILTMLFSISGCYSAQMKAYYADMANFITGEATVKNIIYSEEYNELILWLYDTDPSYQGTTFAIKGNNVSIALENGILDKVKIGDTITITSAPRFFYNGYEMPIIGLSIGDIEILNIEIGHQNLMDMY